VEARGAQNLRVIIVGYSITSASRRAGPSISGVCEAEARETVWLPLCESKSRYSSRLCSRGHEVVLRVNQKLRMRADDEFRKVFTFIS